MNVSDNDSLAARLSVALSADVLMLLTNVNGLYSAPPGKPGSRLLHTYSPTDEPIEFGPRSSVGTGGMDSKVSSHKRI